MFNFRRDVRREVLRAHCKIHGRAISGSVPTCGRARPGSKVLFCTGARYRARSRRAGARDRARTRTRRCCSVRARDIGLGPDVRARATGLEGAVLYGRAISGSVPTCGRARPGSDSDSKVLFCTGARYRARSRRAGARDRARTRRCCSVSGLEPRPTLATIGPGHFISQRRAVKSLGRLVRAYTATSNPFQLGYRREKCDKST